MSNVVVVEERFRDLQTIRSTDGLTLLPNNEDHDTLDGTTPPEATTRLTSSVGNDGKNRNPKEGHIVGFYKLADLKVNKRHSDI